MIKFYDLYRQDKDKHKNIIKEISKSFKHGDFILGSKLADFEKKFAKYCGSKFAIGCGNGTDALTMSLKILDLPKNSEVLIPAMTYCSTAFAVINANLKPVLIDIEGDSPNMDLNLIKKKITKKTRVIMPVHLYGSVVNIDKLKKLIKNTNIKIIDDCSQAHGAEYKNKRKVGSLADISCFSLYPAKNLGAYGDAGIITTNNKKYYIKLIKFRNLGSGKKFIHEYIGFNSRLDNIQSIILLNKLKSLDKYNKMRKEIANFYNKNIQNKYIKKLKYSTNSVFHQYVILVKKKKKFTKLLKKNKIGFSFHYPYPINKLKALTKMYEKQKFNNSEKLANDGISIPIDPNLSKKDVSFIVNTINSYVP